LNALGAILKYLMEISELLKNPPEFFWPILKNQKVTAGPKDPAITYSAMLVVPTLTGGNFLFFASHLDALLI